MKTPKTPPTTAHVMRVFADELEAEGFKEDRVTALLAVALQHELRQSELMVLDGV